MLRVPLHDCEYALLPARQSRAVLTPDYGLVAYIIGHVIDIGGTTQRSDSSEQFWDVGTLHKTEPRLSAPKTLRDFFKRYPIARINPRHGEDFHAHYEESFVQGAVVFNMPNHHGWRAMLGPCEKYCSTGHSRYVLVGNFCHELRDWDQRFAQPRRDSGRATMSYPHDTVHRYGEDQRHIPTLRHF